MCVCACDGERIKVPTHISPHPSLTWECAEPLTFVCEKKTMSVYRPFGANSVRRKRGIRVKDERK